MKKFLLSCLLISNVYAVNYNINMNIGGFTPFLDKMQKQQELISSCNTINESILKIAPQIKLACNFGFDNKETRFSISYNENNLTIIDIEEDSEILQKTSWVIKESLSKNKKEEQISKLISRYVKVKKHEIILKEYILVSNISSSNSIKLDEKLNYISKETNEKLSLEQAISNFKNESTRNRNLWNASLSMAYALGSGKIWYWNQERTRDISWGYRFNTKSFRQKVLNIKSYPFSTTYYEKKEFDHTWYQVNGSEDISKDAEAFLFGFSLSLIWDHYKSFRDNVSIDDTLMTPLAASILSESAYKISNFLISSNKSLLNITLESLLDPINALNSLLVGRSPIRATNLSEFGFNEEVFHNFEIYYGQEAKKDRRYFGFNKKFVDLRKYNEKGSLDDIFIQEI